jgi:hypothetical protein
MASTIFQDYNENNPIVSAWLNDVNNAVYPASGLPNAAAAAPVAWVRFSVAAGVVTINQAVGITGVTRTSTGVYVIQYGVSMVAAQNCYSVSSNLPGFLYTSAETQVGATINFLNVSNTPTDPGGVCFMLFGAQA